MSKSGWKKRTILFIVISVFFLLFLVYELIHEMQVKMKQFIHPKYLSFRSKDISNISHNNIESICKRLNTFYHKIHKLMQKQSLHQEFIDIINDINCPLWNNSDTDFFITANETPIKNKTNTTVVLNHSSNETETFLLDVCPEIYLGNKYKFVHTRCTNVRPLSSIVTIVFNLLNFEKNISEFLEKIVHSIESDYPSLNILITAKLSKFQYNSSNIRIFTYSHKLSTSEIWNNLIKEVNTPYVFLADNLETFTVNAHLERQVSILSSLSNVGIVGGAIRNDEGFWKYNCYQSNMLNYVLKYEEGYYYSRNECMYCNHIEGPFMAKTTVLRQIKFDPKLHLNIFADLFLRINQNNISIMSCPDVMHFVYKLNEFNRKSWLPLAAKWKLNRIYLQDNLVHSFTCKEIHITCSRFIFDSGYLIAPCCIESMTEAIVALTKLFENVNATVMLFFGSVLGAIKMYSPMPWDIDGDIIYQENKYTTLKQNISQLGYKVIWKEPKTYITGDENVTSAYARLFAIDSFSIELWPSNIPLNYKTLTKKQTKIKFGSYYVYVPHNPGLYSRDRYGVNNLKHALSWMTTGKKSSWSSYDAGIFKKCKDINNHACFDHFTPDGNIPFKV